MGQPFLHAALAPLLDQVYGNSAGTELDASHKNYSSTAAERIQHLVQEYLDFLYSTSSLCPSLIRQALSNIKEMVAVAFPESQLKFVGAFIFLRFFCPAIVSPQEFGLVTRK